MQYHLIAFAPFAVLLGTALTVGGMSVIIKFLPLKAESIPVPVPKAPQRSAEIIYFPVEKSRLARPLHAAAGETGRREGILREERHAAIALTGIKAARGSQPVAAIGVYEEIAVSGAGWDQADPIATRRLWDLLCNDPAPARELMRQWSTDENMWRRRCAILCQNRAKQQTDPDLLYGCNEPSMEPKAFCLRKGIGWALREYAWTDPDEIRRHVAENAHRLSGLSRREALENLSAHDKNA